ncbi:DUF6446 family protein [Anianabacter salinae]|uniref:DUF6446 family protein n=1 Tax=Anianabacter salinae TaxID=2851023 RepID=UPI00225E4FFD|nr:DUF6446 family protein [Anianabacter salinae]MBV0913981.1 histidine kinase [Anianabacter salinae]
MGKLMAILLVGCGLIGGAAMYYLQVYAYYDTVDPADVALPAVRVADGAAEPLPVSAVEAIDATSSPIRFRACFETGYSLATMTETYTVYEDATPLVAPGWFDCFDAEAIGDALDAGEAVAFLSIPNVEYGIDRVIAAYDDGRAFAWQQINDCGTAFYDGNPLPFDCPMPPERTE